uniref:hypothetical protein n=1 Tax=Burkholderia pseudomallei TaxID=28450 RepID=UPI001C3C228F
GPPKPAIRAAAAARCCVRAARDVRAAANAAHRRSDGGARSRPLSAPLRFPPPFFAPLRRYASLQ